MSGKRKISHSSLTLLRGCLRQYRHNYIDLRRGKTVSPALAFGSLWDKSLTAWHWGSTPLDRLQRGGAVIAQHPGELQRETANALICGYTAMWGESDVKPIATQVEFTAPIVHPVTGIEHPEYEFTGVLDGVVRVGDRLLGLESKTSSEDIGPGSIYWQRVTTLDPQVSMYLLGAESAGHDIEAVLYDVTRKPALRQGKTETASEYGLRVAKDIQARPEHYFVRQEIVRLESDEASFCQDLWDYAQILKESEVADRWPRNPGNCRQFGRVCDYIGVCTGGVDIEDDSIFERKGRAA